MGRNERRARKWERVAEQREQEYAEYLANKAGLPLGDGEFNENDEVVPRADIVEDENKGPKVLRLWRKKNVAAFFRAHVKTIEEWIKSEGLPCFKVGRTVFFDVSDVLLWVSARKEGV